MTDARAWLAALAGAAMMGSVASLAVPTRMKMTEDSAVAIGIARASFGDAPAYYREPGPEDLVPAAYGTMQYYDSPHSARRLATAREGWIDAVAQSAPQTGHVAPSPDEGPVDYGYSAAEVVAQDHATQVTGEAQSGGASAVPVVDAPQQVAVIDVPAPH